RRRPRSPRSAASTCTRSSASAICARPRPSTRASTEPRRAGDLRRTRVPSDRDDSVRVTYVGHACHLVELAGLRVLTDPWLVDPIFAGSCEHAEPLGFGVADLGRIDAVALTQGHLDHLNAPTLAALPDKSIPVVHPVVTFTEIDEALRLLGFTNLHPREDWAPFELGTLRITPTPSPGVLDECAFFVSGRDGRFFDGADAPQPPELMREIRERLGAPDLAALSHSSFDQPALLGRPSLKPADHAPEAAVRSARLLG